MPCPHLSRVTGDCLLEQDPGPDSDDGREPAVTEIVPGSEGASPLRGVALVNRERCLGTRQSYRACPIFKRFLADLAP
jgi:hypothetical protein